MIINPCSIYFLKQCVRMILSFSNNELITSYESERVASNFIQLHTTKIVWYDTRHDFPYNLSHSTVFNQLAIVGSCVTAFNLYLTRYLCLRYVSERALKGSLTVYVESMFFRLFERNYHWVDTWSANGDVSPSQIAEQKCDFWNTSIFINSRAISWK